MNNREKSTYFSRKNILKPFSKKKLKKTLITFNRILINIFFFQKPINKSINDSTPAYPNKQNENKAVAQTCQSLPGPDPSQKKKYYVTKMRSDCVKKCHKL